MNNLQEKHYFAGGNSSEGFFSLYSHILSQENANRIFCLKGGPGTGKSSLMKKIANTYILKGYSVELFHCSSDNNSLDGLVIKDLNIAIIDGTAPHIVDPITPGAVDEIINLGEAFNVDLISKHKSKILNINANIKKRYNRAYNYLNAAKSILKDWSGLNSENLDDNKLSILVETLKSYLFMNDQTGFGEARHLFSTAITPDGIINFIETLTSNYKDMYILDGGPGLGRSEILRTLGLCAQKKGFKVEYLHNPLVPDELEHILIPELSKCIVSNNELSNNNIKGISFDLNQYVTKNGNTTNTNEIDYNNRLFDELIDKAVSLIAESHVLHDELETFYIAAMDFTVVDDICDNLMNKISLYEIKSQ